MSDAAKWNDWYRSGDLPWDTGHVSSELERVLRAHAIKPCRALDCGCGTGTNSVWLAQQDFDVTGLDISPLAIEQAEARARSAGCAARFLVVDVLRPPDLGAPFDFLFDRGCYHAVRREHPHEYAAAVSRWLAPGAMGLVLAGNDREPHDVGPPVVSEEQIRDELGRVFQIVELREFRFDASPAVSDRFLAWSCLLRK